MGTNELNYLDNLIEEMREKENLTDPFLSGLGM